MITITVTMMNKKYRVEIWINNGAIKEEAKGNNKKVLLKYAKCLCDQLHYQNPWSTSSITLYKGDTILDDLFLNGLNTRYKHIANR